MKGRTLFSIVGWGLVGLTVATFVLHALLQIKTGSDLGYRNYKNQPMTFLGALASFGIAALLGLVALYYRLKRLLQNRRARMAAQDGTSGNV